jgi:hypothetical protein
MQRITPPAPIERNRFFGHTAGNFCPPFSALADGLTHKMGVKYMQGPSVVSLVAPLLHPGNGSLRKKTSVKC